MLSHRMNTSAFFIISAMVAFVFFFSGVSSAQLYVQHNLDTSATDSSLINPWGMVQSSGSPFWISDQGTNVSTLYDGAGTKQGLVVAIPTVTGATKGFPPNGPTGIVFNTSIGSSSPGFNLPGKTAPAVPSIFIFANLNGQISGWNPGSTGTAANAVVEVNNSVTAPPPTTVYTGLAINATGTLLYAANYNAGGGIQAFNNDWTANKTLSFTDPKLPAGYEPYNVTDINGTLFVAYSQIGSGGRPVVAAGDGAVAEFNDATGAFISQLINPGASGGLNVPWGIAKAPAGWGIFGGDLLVGNFGSGWIGAYDPTNGNFLGYLDSAPGVPITDLAMWALEFGTGGGPKGGVKSDPNTLYITAGVDLAQDQGVMAAIDPSPEPATILMLASGLAVLGLLLYRRKTREA